MVRNYKRKNAINYSEDDIKLAIENFKDEMVLSSAPKQFGIPRSTLQDKIVDKQILELVIDQSFYVIKRILYTVNVLCCRLFLCKGDLKTQVAKLSNASNMEI